MVLHLGEDGTPQEVKERGEDGQLSLEPAVDDEFLEVAVQAHEEEHTARQHHVTQEGGEERQVGPEEHQRLGRDAVVTSLCPRLLAVLGGPQDTFLLQVRAGFSNGGGLLFRTHRAVDVAARVHHCVRDFSRDVRSVVVTFRRRSVTQDRGVKPSNCLIYVGVRCCRRGGEEGLGYVRFLKISSSPFRHYPSPSFCLHVDTHIFLAVTVR